MVIKSIRNIAELREILKNPEATGPEIAYWVFSELGNPQWENMTITVAGNYDGEYPKTYGHYHMSSSETEVYKVISGHGIFQLQKKHTENGVFIPNIVDEVFLIGANPGDEIKVPTIYAHSWSNIGDTPLITFDNWKFGHTTHDYDSITTQKGLAYYLISVNNQIKAIPNNNYKNLPDPKWVTASEFNAIFS